MAQHSKCSSSYHDLSLFETELATKSRTDVQTIVDRRIVSLQAELHSLNGIRNRYCPPIASLPPETLSQILTSVVEPKGPYDPQTWRTHVELTRVCVLWRRVAIQCPAFWSCPPLALMHGPVECLREVLARSKDHPLSICMQFPLANLPIRSMAGSSRVFYREGQVYCSEEYHASERMELFRAQAYRLRRLHLKASFRFLQQFQILLAEETPRLESLDILPESFIGINIDNPPKLRFSIERVLRSQTMPNLHHLTLNTDFGIPDWSTLSLSSLGVLNLTTLSLSSVLRCPPYHVLLNILRASPCLQRLELDGFIDRHIVALNGLHGTPPVDRVNLPCLNSIAITATLPEISPFLSCLSLPCELKMDFTLFTRAWDHTYSNLIGDLLLYCGLKTPAGRTQSRRYEVMTLRVDRENCQQLQFSRIRAHSLQPTNLAAAIRYLDSDDTSNALVLKFNTPRYTAIVLEQFDQSLQELRVFHWSEKFALVGPYSSVDWKSFFVKHPSIRSIKLHGWHIGLVLDALQPFGPMLSTDPTAAHATITVGSTNDDSISEAGKEVPLPYLETVLFGGHGLVDYNQATKTFDLTTQDYDTLKSVLLARQQSNRIVSRIGLTRGKRLGPEQIRMKAEILEITQNQSSVIWGY